MFYRLEKEKVLTQREIEDLQNNLDAEIKQRQNIDRLAKQVIRFIYIIISVLKLSKILMFNQDCISERFYICISVILPTFRV